MSKPYMKLSFEHDDGITSTQFGLTHYEEDNQPVDFNIFLEQFLQDVTENFSVDYKEKQTQ